MQQLHLPMLLFPVFETRNNMERISCLQLTFPNRSVSVSCSLWFYLPIQRSGIWHSHLGNVHCDRFLALEWTQVIQHHLCCCSLIRGASSSMPERSKLLYSAYCSNYLLSKAFYDEVSGPPLSLLFFVMGRSDTFWAASSHKVMTGTHFVKLYCCGDFSVVLW
jgi:hypothetical protein